MLQIAYLRNSILLLMMVFAGCAKQATDKYMPFYNTPDFSPMFLQSKGEVNQQMTHTIAPFTFTDQDKKKITERAIAGKIHVADFIFTSCGSICPVMTEQMARVGKAFEKDTSVVILSYSVTPWIDNPDKLKKYREANGIKKPDWHFLTGNKADIYQLARQSYFAEESLGFTKDSTQFLHTEHFVLVDGSKRIRGIYNGTLQLEAEQLIKDINRLKGEKMED